MLKTMKIPGGFSDYIIFADESGDHGITSINPENPVFVLAFCIFKKVDYLSVKQAITKLKLDFWGHDLVILHNHAIRKSTGDFAFLFDEENRRIFVQALNELIRAIPFWIAATTVDKRYLNDYSELNNPYLLALGSCLRQTLSFLEEKNQLQRLTHIIVESRGPPEDRDLGASFKEFSNQMMPEQRPLDIRFASKQSNSSGLQIADLVAHPIARHTIKRDQPNKAFEIVKEKLLGYPEYEEVGLIRHPLESEKPRP
jgi:hypothetical protein